MLDDQHVKLFHSKLQKSVERLNVIVKSWHSFLKSIKSKGTRINCNQIQVKHWLKCHLI